MREQVTIGENVETLTFLTDQEIDAITFRIVELLEGTPLSQALVIVERKLPELLKLGHVVNTSSKRFIGLRKAFLEPQSGFGLLG